MRCWITSPKSEFVALALLAMTGPAGAVFPNAGDLDAVCTLKAEGQEAGPRFVKADALRERMISSAAVPFAEIRKANNQTSSCEVDGEVVPEKPTYATPCDYDALIAADRPDLKRLKSLKRQAFLAASSRATSRDYAYSDKIRARRGESTDPNGFVSWLLTALAEDEAKVKEAEFEASRLDGAAVAYIVCRPADEEEAEPSGVEKFIAENVSVRGDVADLGEPTARRIKAGAEKKFSEYSAAEISLQRNEKDDKSTFAVRGVVGLPWKDKIRIRRGPSFSIIPYAAYERVKTSDDAGVTEVHAVKPGVALKSDWVRLAPFIDADVTLEGAYAIDLAQKAKILSARGRLNPFFSLPNRPLLTGRRWTAGPFAYSAETPVLFEVADILDPGSSAELAGAESYIAVGAHPRIAIGVPGISLLDEFAASVSFRHLEFIGGDIALGHASRFAADLSYHPPGADYMFLTLKFEDGRNEKTFQDEEYWSLSLGLRY